MKPSIYWSSCVPTLTNGKELWDVKSWMRSSLQRAKMSYLCRVAGLSLKIESGDLRTASVLLSIERSQLRWDEHLARMPQGSLSLGRCFRHFQLKETPGQTQCVLQWRDYISRLVWGCLSILSEELVEVAEMRRIWDFSSETVAPMTLTSKWRWDEKICACHLHDSLTSISHFVYRVVTLTMAYFSISVLSHRAQVGGLKLSK